MSNLKSLKTKHYISKILKTKKLKINNKTYIGFNINDAFDKMTTLEYYCEIYNNSINSVMK